MYVWIVMISVVPGLRIFGTSSIERTTGIERIEIMPRGLRNGALKILSFQISRREVKKNVRRATGSRLQKEVGLRNSTSDISAPTPRGAPSDSQMVVNKTVKEKKNKERRIRWLDKQMKNGELASQVAIKEVRANKLLWMAKVR